MQSGLEKLLEQVEILKDAKVGVCCNHTAVTKDFQEIRGSCVGPIISRQNTTLSADFRQMSRSFSRISQKSATLTN